MLEQSTDSFTAIALLDGSNQILSFNSEWQKLAGRELSAAPGSQLSDIAAAIPELVNWVGNSGQAAALRHFSIDGYHLTAQIALLQGAQTQRVLLVNARPATVMTDEDTFGRLRHDIKNRIGGLKLYATFLKRKLTDQAELLDVVGKMINSLDQMTAEANKIRKD
jgi:nitrogen-specific signal transduction histidine kinase